MTVAGSGYVGVGTTSPSVPLHVTNSVGGAQLRLSRPSTANLDIGVSVSGNAVLDLTGAGNDFIIAPSGNVGVGTTTPTARLEVAGTVKATSFDGPMTSSSASFGSGSSAAPSVSFAGDSNTGLFQPGADILGLVTNGIERARIEANGQFNILSGEFKCRWQHGR